MPASFRRKAASLKELLRKEPQRFDFFQAVRLIEWLRREYYGEAERTSYKVGGDITPEKEAIRFKAVQTNTFPANSIDQIEFPNALEDQSPAHVYFYITFMGLTGPAGVLPDHYADLLKDQIHKYKDHTLQDFFDIFNHRTISLFYRAWEKYRVPIIWERSQLESSKMDSFTNSLNCLVGLGTSKLKEQLQISTNSDQIPIFYSGFLSQSLRSAVSLEAMLSDHMNLPVKVEQFHGRWLLLDREERTRLAKQYHRLGSDVVLGECVWNITSSFKIKIESLTYHQFTNFLPTSHQFREMCRLVRFYIGTSLTFVVQPTMVKNQIPRCKLGCDKNHGFYLGWNVWLRSVEDSTHEKRIEGPIFLWNE